MIISRSVQLFVIVLVFASIGSSVSAHSAAQMGVAPDQYDKGIPVYWPIHAGLMSAGFLLLLTGFVVMRYHKTTRWYRSHMLLQSSGGTLAIAGLVTSFSMVVISEAPHFRYSHDLLGIGTILIIIAMLSLGYAITRKYQGHSGLRNTHRWLGRLAIALVAANIILGISMMTMVLAQ